MFDQFDFASYKRMLRWINADRPCVSFPEALELGDAPFCLVRHDIDYSLTSALRMAEVDAELTVKATFFLLFSSPFYNLLTSENTGVPRRLVELGHEVGLHYDTTAVAHLPLDEAMEVLRREAALLGDLSGVPVRAIARHNPSFGGVDLMEQAPDFVSAYDARFTSEITYVSDSCGAWRDEGLEVLASTEPPRNLQLLIHPIFWDERGADRWTHLERLRAAQMEQIEAESAFAREVWGGHPAVGPHDRRVKAALAAVTRQPAEAG